MLFRVLYYHGFEADYILRTIKYYEKEIESIQGKDDYDMAELYMYLAVWSGRAFSLNSDHYYIYSADVVSEYYDKALSLYKKSDKADDTDIANVYNSKGYFLDERDEEENSSEIAIEHYKKAIEMYRKVLPDNDPAIADTYLNIAHAYGYEPQAKEFCEKALAILPENHELRTKAYNILGVIDFLGSPKTAVDYHKQELDYEQSYWDLVVVYDNIVSSAYRAKKYDESLYYAEKLLELCKKLCSFPNKSSSGSEIKTAYLHMANIYNEGYDNYDKAKYYYKKMIEYDIERFGKKGIYDRCFLEHDWIASLEKEYGQYDEALKIYNTLIRHLKNKKELDYVFEDPCWLYMKKVRIYKKLNKKQAAKQNAKSALFYLGKCIEIDENKPSKYFSLSHDYELLSEIYTILERTEEANEAMAKSKEYERISRELCE